MRSGDSAGDASDDGGARDEATGGDKPGSDTADSDKTRGDETGGASTGSTHASYDGGSGPRLSPALIATLVTIPIMVIAGFIAFAALRGPDNNTSNPVESYAAEASVPSDCAKFLAALPDRFTGFDPKRVEGATASWGSNREGGPLTVRCGVTRPAELNPSSALQEVYPVQWFMVDAIANAGQSFVSVDHRPYVAIWIPVQAGNAPITDVSGVIDRTLTRAPLDFG